jgi:hypothetical protein
MVDGSATNCAMEGAGGGGGGGSSLGGGGGGGGATFFLHPVAARNSVNPNRTMLMFRMFNVLMVNLALLGIFKCTSS